MHAPRHRTTSSILALLAAAGLMFACSTTSQLDPNESQAPGQPGGDDDIGFTSSSGATGGGTNDDEICHAVSQEVTTQIRPVDIIWAIDTSPSMTAEKQAVRDKLNVFAQQITASNIDVHVIMIATPLNQGGICVDAPLGSGSCPNDHNPPHFHHNTNWVGSHNALERFISEYPEYKSALRENSLKYFAFVTDDSANLDAASFSNTVNQLDAGWWNDWKVLGLYCANRDSGGTYQSLVSQTGGIGVELCQSKPDWQAVFDGFVSDVIENKALACEWEIPEHPEGKELDPNKVNVSYTAGGKQSSQPIYFAGTSDECGTGGGWYYDNPNNPTTIKLCEQTCKAIQGDVEGKIDILFGCLTESSPK